jgi:ABC-2 type transport system ATP-binding protein
MRVAATIEVTGLCKRFGPAVALDGLLFTVLPGRAAGLAGPNGAGKPATMRMIAGLDEPTAGRVRVNGRDHRAAPAPMAELGIEAGARAMHTGRSARNHLLALAQTNGVSRRRTAQQARHHLTSHPHHPATTSLGDEGRPGAWKER